MPPMAFADIFSALTTFTATATLLDGGLAILLSIFFAGGRALRRRSVRVRLRTELLATVFLIGLAALDIFLTMQYLTGQ